ncbi:hypothetical protein [Oryza sativa Japonica Group]|uniref:Uncharacterized protein n=1 Tax=Oryza sativa subsp. japonica TaxID=39947 RepID=Q5N809_ORYSJ|nr:hypothetical protein [Oryza sativa Japonica Group]
MEIRRCYSLQGYDAWCCGHVNLGPPHRKQLRPILKKNGDLILPRYLQRVALER